MKGGLPLKVTENKRKPMFAETLQFLSNAAMLVVAAILFHKRHYHLALIFALIFPFSEFYHACNDPVVFGAGKYVLPDALRCANPSADLRVVSGFFDYFIANWAPMALAICIMPMRGGRDYRWMLTVLSGILLFGAAFLIGMLDPAQVDAASARLIYVNAAVVVYIAFLFWLHARLYAQGLDKPVGESLRAFYGKNFDVRLLGIGLGLGVFALVVWRVIQPLLPVQGLVVHASWHLLSAFALGLVAASMRF